MSLKPNPSTGSILSRYESHVKFYNQALDLFDACRFGPRTFAFFPCSRWRGVLAICHQAFARVYVYQPVDSLVPRSRIVRRAERRCCRRRLGSTVSSLISKTAEGPRGSYTNRPNYKGPAFSSIGSCESINQPDILARARSDHRFAGPWTTIRIWRKSSNSRAQPQRDADLKSVLRIDRDAGSIRPDQFRVRASHRSGLRYRFNSPTISGLRPR